MEDADSQKGAHFVPLERMVGQGFYFSSLGDTLLAASRNGLDMILNNKIVKRFNYASSAILRSTADPQRIYVGLRNGLAVIKYDNGTWKDDGVIAEVQDDIREIVEDKKGNLWLESQVDGVWKVDFSNSSRKKDSGTAEVRHFRANNELPEGLFIFYPRLEGNQCLTLKIKSMDIRKIWIVILLQPELGERLGLQGKISPKLEDKRGNIWMWAQLADEASKSRVLATKIDQESYKISKIRDERVSQDVRKSLLPEQNGIIWYGGRDGIVRHDLNFNKDYDQDFNTYIRSVSVANDSLVFGGTDIEDSGIELPL